MATVLAAAPLAGVAGVAGVAGGIVDLPAAGASTSMCPAPARVTPAEDSADSGVTPTSVTVANVSTVTGPVPGLFEGAPTGTRAYFAYVNSTGGVYGRRLDVQAMDDGFSGLQNGSETRNAESADFAMVGNFSLEDSYGCSTLADDPAFPDVSVTLDPTTNALPNVYSAQPLALGMGLGMLEYFRHHFPKATRLGTVVTTTPTAVAQWDGEVAALHHAGFTIAYQQKVGPLTSTFTTEVIKMRDAGVNFVYLVAMDWQVAAILTQEMAQQDWHPTVVLSGGPIYADQFITRAGAAAADGDWLGQVQSLYLGQDAKVIPADAEFLKWVQKVNPGWTPDMYTLYGWISAQLFVQALRAAGPHPTRGSVLAQLGKVTSFDASGLIAPNDPAGKRPSTCTLIARVEHGRFVRVDPPRAGFLCGGGFYAAPGSA